MTGAGNTINSSLGRRARRVEHRHRRERRSPSSASTPATAPAAADPANGIVLNTTGSAGELTVTGSGGNLHQREHDRLHRRHDPEHDRRRQLVRDSGRHRHRAQQHARRRRFTRMRIHDHSNYGIRGTARDRPHARRQRHQRHERHERPGPVRGQQRQVHGPDRHGVRHGHRHQRRPQRQPHRRQQRLGDAGRHRRPGSTSARSAPRSATTPCSFNGVGEHGHDDGRDRHTAATFTSAVGDIFQWIADGTGGGDLVFTGNTVSNNHPAIANGGGGVTLTGGARAAATLNVDNNTFRDSHTAALTVNKSRDDTAGAGSLTGTINSNTIGVVGRRELRLARGRGHRGHALRREQLQPDDHEQRDPPVQQLRHVRSSSGGGIAESGAFNLNISGNTISNPGTNPSVTLLQGIGVNSGVAAGDTLPDLRQLRGEHDHGLERRGEQGLPPARAAEHDRPAARLRRRATSPEPTRPCRPSSSGKIGGGAQGTALTVRQPASSSVPGRRAPRVARWLNRS